MSLVNKVLWLLLGVCMGMIIMYALNIFPENGLLMKVKTSKLIQKVLVVLSVLCMLFISISWVYLDYWR